MKDCCPNCNGYLVNCNVKENKYKCFGCGTKWKENYKLVYDCNNCNLHSRETNITLNLYKDGKTNWTKCNGCGRFVNYRFMNKCELVN